MHEHNEHDFAAANYSEQAENLRLRAGDYNSRASKASKRAGSAGNDKELAQSLSRDAKSASKEAKYYSEEAEALEEKAKTEHKMADREREMEDHLDEYESEHRPAAGGRPKHGHRPIKKGVSSLDPRVRVAPGKENLPIDEYPDPDKPFERYSAMGGIDTTSEEVVGDVADYVSKNSPMSKINGEEHDFDGSGRLLEKTVNVAKSHMQAGNNVTAESIINKAVDDKHSGLNATVKAAVKHEAISELKEGISNGSVQRAVRELPKVAIDKAEEIKGLAGGAKRALPENLSKIAKNAELAKDGLEEEMSPLMSKMSRYI